MGFLNDIARWAPNANVRRDVMNVHFLSGFDCIDFLTMAGTLLFVGGFVKPSYYHFGTLSYLFLVLHRE